MHTVLLALTLLTTSAHSAEVVVVLPEGMPITALRHPGVGFAEGGRGRTRRLTVDPSGEVWLAELGVAVVAIAPPPTPEGYRSPEAMVAAMDHLVEAAPELVERVDIGRSARGRPIVALRMGTSEQPRTRLRVLGAHHGDEPISATLAIETAAALTEGWLSEDSLFEDFFTDNEVWVVPHVNPDGVADHTRHNARDVDLNRNYGHLWSATEYHPGEHAFSELETQAVQALAVRAPSAMGLSLHSGAANFGWVWNYTTEPSPDAVFLEALANDYADQCTIPDFWITNGADWYSTNGDTNDWAYGHWGTFDFTVELSEEKAPAPGDIDAVVDAHLSATVNFLIGPELMSGRLVDQTTGLPLAGTLTDAVTGSRLRASSDGIFARVTSEHSFMVDVPGYASRSIAGDEQHGDLLLTPAIPWQDRTIQPQVVRAGGVETLALERGATEVTLHPPGQEALTPIITEGTFELSLLGGPPGLWIVDAGDHRSGLRVDGETAVRVLNVDRDTEGWTVTMEPVSAGSRLWVWVDGQVAADLPLSKGDAAVFVARTELPGNDRSDVDLTIWGAGGPTWVCDLHNTMVFWGGSVSGTHALDTGQYWTPSDGRVTGCGCQTRPLGTGVWLLALLPVYLRRRR